MKERKIEEVKEFAYLRYTIQRNGGQETYVRNRIRKATAVNGNGAGIKVGKRRFGKDWKERGSGYLTD